MTSSRTLPVSLRMPVELLTWVRGQVAKGRAGSVTEVINDLVREAKHNDNPRGK